MHVWLAKIFIGSNFRTLCTCSNYAKIFTNRKFPAIRYARLHVCVCVCVCVCRIYWTYSQHKQYYCRVDDEVAWPPLHPTSSTQKTALPARLQNIAANHCHAVTWGSSCDQISITLSCGCRDVCSSSCLNDKVRKFHSLLIFLGQLYNSQEKEGEIIP